MSAEVKERLLDYVERYTMTMLYRILFCSPYTTDEEKDLAIQNRYKSFIKKFTFSKSTLKINFHIVAE